MLDEFSEREAGLILEFQRASYSNVFPSLRLISITIQERSPDVFFFYDGEISEDDLESISLMMTYFGIDYFEGLDEGGWTYTRIDYPEPIPKIPGECVYARRENPPLVRPKRGVLMDRWMDRYTKICVAQGRAMLNNVFPKIRKISAEYDEISSIIHVFVDGPIDEEDRKSLELMKYYFALQFPPEEMVRCELSIDRVDAPAKMPGYDICTYIRKEMPNYPSSLC